VTEPVRLPFTEDCFVCGRGNPCGLHTAAVYDQASRCVVVRFTPSRHHCGYRALAHGGILSTLLDEVMGWAPSYETRRMCVAAEITIRFVKPVPIGTEVIVTGRFVEDRRRLWRCEGAVEGTDGTLYVRGSGTYVPIPEGEAARIEAEQLIYPEGMPKLFS